MRAATRASPGPHARRRRPAVRATTIAVRRPHHSDRERVSLAILDEVSRPAHRSDCQDGPRPCPWVSCRHHLYLDVKDNGSIKMNFPGSDLDDLVETCSLDVAERDGCRLQEVAEVLNLSKERVRQVEFAALVQASKVLG